MLGEIMIYAKIGLMCMLISLSFVIGSQYNQVKASEYIADLPIIKGKIVYHTYSDYIQRDSKLYIFDFETKENTCVSDKFQGVYHTMNADFGNNGSEITFMGLVNNEGNEEWDIFRYNLETKQLDNLTKGNELRDEDPKYSPDGTKIIFKQGHWSQVLDEMVYDIMEMDLVSGGLKQITNDTNEESMPYYMSDGKSVYYAKGLDKSSQIYKVNLDNTNAITEIYAESGIRSYYPIVYNNTLYFSKWYSESNKSDVIVKMDLNTNKITIPPFNSGDYNCSDACPISERYIIISSTIWEGKGGYDLYMADMETGEMWSMDLFNTDINDEKSQLGAAYYFN